MNSTKRTISLRKVVKQKTMEENNKKMKKEKHTQKKQPGISQ